MSDNVVEPLVRKRGPKPSVDDLEIRARFLALEILERKKAEVKVTVEEAKP